MPVKYYTSIPILHFNILQYKDMKHLVTSLLGFKKRQNLCHPISSVNTVLSTVVLSQQLNLASIAYSF